MQDLFSASATADGTPAMHASLVNIQGIGCLLVGPSGSGKSRLAAECLALGGKLVADDKVLLTLESGMLMGGTSRATQGVIELRGVGLAKQPDAALRQVIHVAVALVPLEQVERLPSWQKTTLLGVDIPVIQLPAVPHTNALFLSAAVRAVYEGRILAPDWKP